MKFKVGDKVLIEKTTDVPSCINGIEGTIVKTGGYKNTLILVQFIGRTDLHTGDGFSKKKDCYWLNDTDLKLINNPMEKEKKLKPMTYKVTKEKEIVKTIPKPKYELGKSYLYHNTDANFAPELMIFDYGYFATADEEWTYRTVTKLFLTEKELDKYIIK